MTLWHSKCSRKHYECHKGKFCFSTWFLRLSFNIVGYIYLLNSVFMNSIGLLLRLLNKIKDLEFDEKEVLKNLNDLIFTKQSSELSLSTRYWIKDFIKFPLRDEKRLNMSVGKMIFWEMLNIFDKTRWSAQILRTIST